MAPAQSDLVAIGHSLSAQVSALRFAPPVAHVYNPLEYAWDLHRAYLERYGSGRKEVVLLGMNPGPFGMVQTGVPFGEVGAVRDWMGLSGTVVAPRHQHPKRPIQGLSCQRSEVSGARLWGWARDRFGTPEAFFRRFFVVNYCPLAFLEEGGKNRTPDKLPAREREALFSVCDKALQDTVAALKPKWVIGIGAFAEKRASEVVGDRVSIGRILHPSPASPAANRGWAEAAEKQLSELAIPIGG